MLLVIFIYDFFFQLYTYIYHRVSFYANIRIYIYIYIYIYIDLSAVSKIWVQKICKRKKTFILEIREKKFVLYMMVHGMLDSWSHKSHN
jgi:hypothetical protein